MESGTHHQVKTALKQTLVYPVVAPGFPPQVGQVKSGESDEFCHNVPLWSHHLCLSTLIQTLAYQILLTLTSFGKDFKSFNSFKFITTIKLYSFPFFCFQAKVVIAVSRQKRTLICTDTNLSWYIYKSKYKKVGVLPLRIVKSLKIVTFRAWAFVREKPV